MVYFQSDYIMGAHPEILRRLTETNFEALAGYGFDKYCDSAKEKIKLLRERNIPIWVMEPLRGGKLCSLDSKYEERLKALRPDHTVPEWAFRFLQSFSDVTVTLSGMSIP